MSDPTATRCWRSEVPVGHEWRHVRREPGSWSAQTQSAAKDYKLMPDEDYMVECRPPVPPKRLTIEIDEATARDVERYWRTSGGLYKSIVNAVREARQAPDSDVLMVAVPMELAAKCAHGVATRPGVRGNYGSNDRAAVLVADAYNAREKNR